MDPSICRRQGAWARSSVRRFASGCPVVSVPGLARQGNEVQRLDEIARSDFDQPKSGTKGVGQDARSNRTCVVPYRYGVFSWAAHREILEGPGVPREPTMAADAEAVAEAVAERMKSRS